MPDVCFFAGSKASDLYQRNEQTNQYQKVKTLKYISDESGSKKKYISGNNTIV